MVRNRLLLLLSNLVWDFPQCFSKPIGYFALELDEMMPPKVRQRRLTPFVCRIAGTRGSARIEKKRIVHICRGLERITFGGDFEYDDYTMLLIGFLVGHVKDERAVRARCLRQRRAA
jgi:hypothetical protein